MSAKQTQAPIEKYSPKCCDCLHWQEIKDRHIADVGECYRFPQTIRKGGSLRACGEFEFIATEAE